MHRALSGNNFHSIVRTETSSCAEPVKVDLASKPDDLDCLNRQHGSIVRTGSFVERTGDERTFV